MEETSCLIKQVGVWKCLRSKDYNFDLNCKNGFFARWGETKEADPQFSPFGCEILDMEISTICKGYDGSPCHFCYKSNGPVGKNMSFATFKKIFDKIIKTNKILGQIAFGSGASAIENPDIWKIMEYCRKNNVVPNITVANISDETADKLVQYCGAVAVSRYQDKNYCYDCVKKLTDRGLKQTNIHQIVALQSYDQCIETINDIKTDHKLSKLNAIVLLSLKQKGRGIGYTRLPQDNFDNLVNLCFEKKINFGMDSCGATKFIKSIKSNPQKEIIEKSVEPCESAIFSLYCNVEGEVFPCSFCENIEGFEQGISIADCKDFIKDIWNHSKIQMFREKLLKNKRSCPIYEV